ncbi:hypothetical protein [Flavobacterium sp. GCM10027622]|uniref:hypothetical protein n=1 Tax=unclassified Flavobacterium TaxID=196869 RepID=UPI0036129917
MKSLIALLLTFSINSFAQQKKLDIEKDLAYLVGKWKGELTYLDYSSGKPYTMPAEVFIDKIDNYNYLYQNIYPNETKANSTDTLVISKDGALFNKKSIKKIKRTKLAIEIITEIKGTDGNDKKAALLRNTYFISSKKYTIIKDVQFEGTKNWIKRHEYSFTKN